MEVEYVIKPDDFVAFCIFCFRRLSWGRRHPLFLVWLMLLAVSLACNVLVLPETMSGVYRSERIAWAFLPAPVLLLLGVVSLLTARMRARWRALRALKSKALKGIVGWHRLVVDPEGLTEANEQIPLTIRWSGVASIEAVEQYAFFCTTNGGAVILPKQSFLTEHAFLDFVATARQYWDAAKRATPTPALVPPKRADGKEDRITRAKGGDS
jgi:hypothetical protein